MSVRPILHGSIPISSWNWRYVLESPRAFDSRSSLRASAASRPAVLGSPEFVEHSRPFIHQVDDLIHPATSETGRAYLNTAFSITQSNLRVHVHIPSMATKTLTIREEVYDRLKSMKRDDESFSDLLERLSGSDKDVMSGFGVLADEGGEEFAAGVEEARERMDRDFKERADDLFGQ